MWKFRRRKKVLLVGLTGLFMIYLLVFLEQWNNLSVSSQILDSALVARSKSSSLVERKANLTGKNGLNSSNIAGQKIIQATLGRSDSAHNSECHKWASFAPKPPYYLTAVLLVRIYEKDKAKLTTAELKMWLQYLRYAGVEHVYIYDAFVYNNESQLPHLKEFLKDGYVTYIDWHIHNPYTISGTQVTAYQNCIDVYKNECMWQTAIDIDEYPFSPTDQSPGFLKRYLKQQENEHSRVSEISMANFLFLGKPAEKELMIERIMRRTANRSNVLSKPIYKPHNVHKASVHHNPLRTGYRATAHVQELRLNHYWGARLQDWGPNTEETMKVTVADDTMLPIVRAFRRCKGLIRRYLQ